MVKVMIVIFVIRDLIPQIMLRTNSAELDIDCDFLLTIAICCIQIVSSSNLNKLLRNS